jgi:hypothetical protein
VNRWERVLRSALHGTVLYIREPEDRDGIEDTRARVKAIWEGAAKKQKPLRFADRGKR